MSLINQMLQDLDARKVAHGTGSGLPNDVRPLPRPQSSRLPLIVGILALLILLAALVAYWFMSTATWERPVVSADTSQVAAVPVTVSPPVPIPQPDNNAPSSAVQVSALPAEHPAAETALETLDGSLRIADVLGAPNEKKTSVRTVRENPAMEKKSSKPESAERPSPKANVLPPEPPKPASPPSIEKTEAQGSPRDRVEAEYRKAITAVNQGKVDEALNGLRSALQQDRFHQASRQLLVKLLLEARQSDEAERVLQDGLQSQPAQLGWAMALARLQVDRGDFVAAWQTLNYSQPAASGNADYQGFSGHVLQRLGRHKEAIERYLAAARLSPTDGRWWLGLGLSLDADGRGDEAREAFQKAKSTGTLNGELSALVDRKLH